MEGGLRVGGFSLRRPNSNRSLFWRGRSFFWIVTMRVNMGVAMGMGMRRDKENRRSSEQRRRRELLEVVAHHGLDLRGEGLDVGSRHLVDCHKNCSQAVRTLARAELNLLHRLFVHSDIEGEKRVLRGHDSSLGHDSFEVEWLFVFLVLTTPDTAAAMGTSPPTGGGTGREVKGLETL
jgi:hypothetical protein